MITANRRPLSDLEARAVIQWFAHDGFGEFRTCLRDKLVELEAKAGEASIDSINRDAEVEADRKEAIFIRLMIQYLDEVRSKQRELYRVSLSINE